MTSIMRIFSDISEARDPRSDGFLLGNWPTTTSIILIFYLLVIFKIGPAFMSSRKPYDLRNVIMAYNWFQIIANCFLFVNAAKYCLTYNMTCNLVDSSDDPDAVYLVSLFYYYHVLKIFDLIETVFFVLRKKQSQVSFLHVYHHILMTFTTGIFFKFYPGGQSVYLGLANTFIHIIMYFYYFLTAWDSSYKQSIWWKKHITQIQLVQHFFVTFCFAAPLFTENCQYPKFPSFLALPNCFIMIYLFGEFYWRTYIIESNKNAAEAKSH